MNGPCQELQDIRFKTMFITGNGIADNHAISDIDNEKNISNFLNKELIKNKLEPWSKLNKTAKITKIKEYSNKYCIDNELDSEEKNTLEEYLLNSLDRKRLTNIKDVQYDRENGVIKNIPMLTYNSSTRKFTLKRSDKRTSTIKHLTQHNASKNNKSSKSKKDKISKDKISKGKISTNKQDANVIANLNEKSTK